MKAVACGVFLFLSAVLSAASAQAHFQLVYTPLVNVSRAGDIPLKLIFWHPFDNGHVMDMGAPEEFYFVHKGKKVDLKGTLKPITFSGVSNAAQAYEAKATVRRNGDYIFVLTPSPYYEESEDIYIQQVAKAYVNKGGVPSGWQNPVGLPVEIVPLNKPTNIMAGSTFSGRVLADGQPVPGAELEIEYMAAEPDMATNRPMAAKASPLPGGAIVAISDDNGYFTIGIPKAGFWGIAALGAGPKKEYKGKELSHDAVLWIKAHEVK